MLWARETLASVPRPRLILNLGSAMADQAMAPGAFRRGRQASGRGIRRRAGLRGITRGRFRWPRRFASAIGPLPLLDLSGQTTLLQLAALARESHLFVSNDTGPLHLAAAAGAAVVGIYTCTNPRLTGPYGPSATTVQSCVWCAA